MQSSGWYIIRVSAIHMVLAGGYKKAGELQVVIVNLSWSRSSWIRCLMYPF